MELTLNSGEFARMKHVLNKVAAVVAVVIAAGCGSDQSTTPPLPQITIVSGNDQAVPSGLPLPLPLVVQAKAADGSPLAGLPIDWKVVSGGGSLSNVDSVTNAQGVASAEWTLGYSYGEQTVSASLGGANFGVGFMATGSIDQNGPPPPPGPSATPQLVGMRYDGTSWSAQLFADTLGPVMMYAAWGSSPSDVYAFGQNCYLAHFDGSAWSAPRQACSGVVTNVISIDGNSSSDIYAIQRFTKVPGPTYYQSRILHYNGQSWDSVYHFPIGRPDFVELRAIASRSSTDVIAVADSGYIVRYDGASWTISKSGVGKTLRGVWADKTSPAIFAVGDGGTILYYDGTAWTQQSSGTTTQLQDVWGSSRSNVYAVGWGGVLLHYDGSSWTAVNTGTTSALLDVSGSGDSNVYAVGYDVVLHYDGTTWKTVTPPVPMRFRGVWVGQGFMYAVGCPSASPGCWPG